MNKANMCCALIALSLLTVPAMAGVEAYIFDDSSYLSDGDSPFDLFGPGSDFLLEDFEDGLLNSPGLIGFGGEVRFPSAFTDSVDLDDGVLDGLGQNGHNFWAFAGIRGPVARFEFDAKALGGLPTQVGLVWTDGNVDAITFFEAWDNNGQSLGVQELVLGNVGHLGGTGEDRFMGAISDAGISAIEIRATLGRIEVDHVQYGDIIPAPGVLALLGLSGLIVRRSRRRLTISGRRI